jgi:hypothetical protein
MPVEGLTQLEEEESSTPEINAIPPFYPEGVKC